MTGLYIHIPFCARKCPYCDFYSFAGTETEKDDYLKAVLACLKKWSSTIHEPVDTVYFGGGTPSVFGGERIAAILDGIRENYALTGDAEITVECNPSSVSDDFFRVLHRHGVNRLSMGLQSAVDSERLRLGRTSSAAQVEAAVKAAKEVGFRNISLDVMLGVPGQKKESLRETLDFLLKLDIPHISAYMLKIEEGTTFHKLQNCLSLPDEDTVCDFYLQTAQKLKDAGYHHYEISNFAREGFESRHNLRYWKGEDYLGIGPSAHSFLGGKRFFYQRDFQAFLAGAEPTYDGEGGDEEEYIMLHLRLSSGLNFTEFQNKYGKDIKNEITQKAKPYQDAELLTCDEDGIRLTEKGFLVSNSIIASLI